jgi:Spy/CpxP family protein refolding chaperone
MNKLKLLAGIVLLFCVGAFAGVLGTGAYFAHRFERFTGSGHRPPLARLLIERLTYKLDLTKTQEAEVREIIDQTRLKLHDLREKYQPEMEALIESSLQSVKEKLNGEQRTKIDEMYTKLKNRWRAREGAHEIAAPRTPLESFDRFKAALGLTETQQAKVRQIIEDSFKDRHEIIRKYRKQGHVLERSLRQEIKENRDSVEKRLAKVLMKDQMEKYRQFEKEQPQRPYPEMRLHGLDRF